MLLQLLPAHDFCFSHSRPCDRLNFSDQGSARDNSRTELDAMQDEIGSYCVPVYEFHLQETVHS